jgi:hypothetical protein
MRKFTLFLSLFFAMALTAMAQSTTPVLRLTEIGTAPYQLSEEDAAKVFALTDLTIALKVNTPSAMSGRKALFCTSDPTKAANVDAMPSGSAYVAYGTNDATTAYLAAVVGARTNDREAVYENLKVAVQRSAQMKTKAQNDIEFAKYQQDEQFQTIVK